MAQTKAKTPERPAVGPWPHRTAWALACAVFPLIWMGGLVTTYDAGMAVPDWPNTYGYNLFLYPLASWLGAWDVFLEHSHRLIGAAVGLIAILLAVLLWRRDGRRWMRLLGVAAVVGVSLQGTLGGLRVLGNEVLLADIHGCVAPLYFAFCAAVVSLTSPRWRKSRPVPAPPRPGAAAGFSSSVAMRWTTLITAIGVWLQIVLGAQLRHVPQGIPLGPFMLWVWLHVILAGLLSFNVLSLMAIARRRTDETRFLVRRAWLLAGLFLLQLLLGSVTWVTNYGWPLWFTGYIWDPGYTVVAAGPLQAVVTTAHVAVGSLTLAAAVTLAVWSRRDGVTR